MKTNRLLLAAGLLAVFTAAMHTLVGTPETLGSLLESSLAHPIRLVLYATWHLVSLTLALSAVGLVWSSLPRNRAAAGALPIFISLLWLLFGLVFVTVALVFSGPSALFVMPQWVVLIPVGVLGLIGSRKQAASKGA